MVKWYENLYMDENVRKNPDKYREYINQGKFTIGLYCITLASNENNLFDIIESNELFFRHYKENMLYIVGLARGKERAVRLASELVLETYSKTGAFNVREYFKFQ